MSSRPEDQLSPKASTYPPTTTVPDIHASQPPVASRPEDQLSPKASYPPTTTVPDIHASQPPVASRPEDQHSPKASYPPTTTVPDIHASQPPPTAPEEETKKWGTHIMGSPAAPNVHPDNQKAALWKAADHQQIPQQPLEQQAQQQQAPYVQYSPMNKPNNNPLEPVISMFNSWGNKAENIARSIWHNLKTAPSVSEAAWGKLNLTAKAITEGGFESLFKQNFATDPNEKLLKTFACYLSTSTGPVAGTLYLSTARIGFCSDRPLSFTAPSGQSAWSYYKVMIPLTNAGSVTPVVMTENPPAKYLQIVTTDGHEFWFMGFVNFEKAAHHMLETVSNLRAVGTSEVQPPVV